MAQPDIDTVLGWRGRTIVDRDGEKIGKFDEIYLDAATDRPEWAQVKMGLLGRERALVPLAGAEEAGDDLRVPIEKAAVEAGPDIDPEAELSQEQEAELYRHYGIDFRDEESDTVMPSGESEGGAGVGGGGADREAAGAGAEAGGADRDAGGAAVEPPGADREAAGAGAEARGGPAEGGAEVTRSEEEVHTGVESRPLERVRLKKYVVTEHVTKTVPVQREELRLEREPVEGEPGEAAGDPAPRPREPR
jgi:hypothetical protein